MQPDEIQQDVTTVTPIDSQANEVETPISESTSQSNGSTPTDLPPTAPESPTDVPTLIPVVKIKMEG